MRKLLTKKVRKNWDGQNMEFFPNLAKKTNNFVGKKMQKTQILHKSRKKQKNSMFVFFPLGPENRLSLPSLLKPFAGMNPSNIYLIFGHNLLKLQRTSISANCTWTCGWCWTLLQCMSHSENFRSAHAREFFCSLRQKEEEYTARSDESKAL